jgi:hypothetical protein
VEIQDPLAAFASVKFNHTPVYLFPGLPPYEVTECAFYLCEKTYENAKVSGGTITADPTLDKDRQLYQTPWYNLEGYNYLSFDTSDNCITNPTNSGCNSGIGDPIAPAGVQLPYGTYNIEYINLGSELQKNPQPHRHRRPHE